MESVKVLFRLIPRPPIHPPTFFSYYPSVNGLSRLLAHKRALILLPRCQTFGDWEGTCEWDGTRGVLCLRVGRQGPIGLEPHGVIVRGRRTSHGPVAAANLVGRPLETPVYAPDGTLSKQTKQNLSESLFRKVTLRLLPCQTNIRSFSLWFNYFLIQSSISPLFHYQTLLKQRYFICFARLFYWYFLKEGLRKTSP